MNHPTMADLTPGTRIRHLKWGLTGTIRQCGPDREVRWDRLVTADQISDHGVVFPAHVEILKAGR